MIWSVSTYKVRAINGVPPDTRSDVQLARNRKPWSGVGTK